MQIVKQFNCIKRFRDRFPRVLSIDGNWAILFEFVYLDSSLSFLAVWQLLRDYLDRKKSCLYDTTVSHGKVFLF